METEVKKQRIKEIWSGESAERLRHHISHYIATKDEEYFQQHLHVPFTVLINYVFVNLVLPKNPYINQIGFEEDDIIGDVWVKLLNSFESYDTKKNPYQYFLMVIRNSMYYTINSKFFKKRDFKKCVSIEELQEDNNGEPTSWEPYLTVEEDNSAEVIEDYKQRLKEFLADNPPTKTDRKYYQFLQSVVDGKVEIPDCGIKGTKKFLNVVTGKNKGANIKSKNRVRDSILKYEDAKRPLPERKDRRWKWYYNQILKKRKKGIINCDE